MKPKRSGVVDFDYLTNFCKVDSLDKVLDDISLYSETYGVAYTEARQEGKSEAEEIALKTESDEQGEYLSRYKSAVEQASARVFEEHGLELHALKDGWRFRILPKVSWMDALRSILTTISGIGEWEFSSAKELIYTSSSKNARDCVLGASHHMRRWHEVYGEPSPASQIERAMRY